MSPDVKIASENESAAVAENSRGAGTTEKALPQDYNLLVDEVQWRLELLEAKRRAKFGHRRRDRLSFVLTPTPEGLEIRMSVSFTDPDGATSQGPTRTWLSSWDVVTEGMPATAWMYDRGALDQSGGGCFLRRPNYFERSEKGIPGTAVVLVRDSRTSGGHELPPRLPFTEVVHEVDIPDFVSYDERLIRLAELEAADQYRYGGIWTGIWDDRPVVLLIPPTAPAAGGVR